MAKRLRIQFMGCSGIGKTTLATWLAETLNIPFVSASYSDLVPETKKLTHEDMMNQPYNIIYEQDIKALKARSKLFSQHPEYVSDRSYIDSVAYMIHKLSQHLRECDIDTFVESSRILTGMQCDYLVFIPFTQQYFKHWEIEDNNKRVLNRYFQFQISELMSSVLDLFHVDYTNMLDGYRLGFLPLKGRIIKVLVIYSLDLEQRKQILLNCFKDEAKVNSPDNK